MTAMLISKSCLTEVMDIVHVSSKGQIVIPKAMRNRLHLRPGTRMILFEQDKGFMLKREDAVDPDTILTPAERRQVRRAEQEFREGRTISHEELKRELGIK